MSNYDACEDGKVDQCIEYWLTAYLPKQRAVLVQASAYESHGVHFISIATGKVLTLEDEPHFSPSGNRFVVVKASEAETVYNHVAIYSAGVDPPTLEFAFPAGKIYALYSFVSWDGENRIRLNVHMWDKAKTALKDFAASAVRTQKGWRLEEPVLGP